MKLLAYYPYRKAWVRGNTVHFPRDLMRGFELQIAYMAEKSDITYLDDHYGHMRFRGINCGNHTCFTLEMECGKICSFMFTDSLMIMGDRVDIENW